MLIKNDPSALSLFLTEPIYLVKEETHGEPAKTLEKSPDEAVEKHTSPEPLVYEGKYLKKILLLYKGAAPQLPDAQRTFLGKILEAVKLDFEDVALVNTSFLHPEQFSLLKEMKAKVWLSFGVAHETLPIKENTPQYKIIKTENTSLLLANALEEIEAHRDKKVLLWNNLKLLFDI